MLDEHIPRRSFLGIAIGGRMGEQLARAQRALYGVSRCETRKAMSLPRRIVTIPLVDLGEPRLDALEAAQLATDRVLRGRKPFTVALGPIGVWPQAENPELVGVELIDESGQLRSLREQLVETTNRFHFAENTGTYQGLIPLIRLRGDGPPIDTSAIKCVGELEINAVSAFTQLDKFGKFRMRLLWSRAFDQSAPFEHLSVDDGGMSELHRQLDERLAARKSNFKSRRVRKKVADLTTDLDPDEPHQTDVNA
jgi:2'-5' RNA ligase